MSRPMHTTTLKKWQHDHEFNRTNASNETKTLRVVILTAAMMGLEIAAGAYYGSMALLADGWHMGTHAAALGISLFAYAYARKHASDPRYTFGTGKIGVLGGFSSAIVLQVVALAMMFEAASRLFNPRSIRFAEAIAVAVLGLLVNLLSVRLLGTEHEHESSHAHNQDHNLRAAYMHVLADALTSVLAILALLAGRFFGWLWLDALTGILGSLVISKWAIGLLRDTGHILLDGRSDDKLVDQIKTTLESEADTRLSDLHVWQMSSHDAAAIISLVTHDPRPVEHYRTLLQNIPELKHVTIEVHKCQDAQCIPGD